MTLFLHKALIMRKILHMGVVLAYKGFQGSKRQPPAYPTLTSSSSLHRSIA